MRENGLLLKSRIIEYGMQELYQPILYRHVCLERLRHDAPLMQRSSKFWAEIGTVDLFAFIERSLLWQRRLVQEQNWCM